MHAHEGAIMFYAQLNRCGLNRAQVTCCRSYSPELVLQVHGADLCDRLSSLDLCKQCSLHQHAVCHCSTTLVCSSAVALNAQPARKFLCLL